MTLKIGRDKDIHLLTQRRDVPRRLDDPLPPVVVLVQLVPERLEDQLDLALLAVARTWFGHLGHGRVGGVGVGHGDVRGDGHCGGCCGRRVFLFLLDGVVAVGGNGIAVAVRFDVD